MIALTSSSVLSSSTRPAMSSYPAPRVEEVQLVLDAEHLARLRLVVGVDA
jgi:hypothetical protein